MDINQTLDNIAGYSPSVDAIGQVRVISANAPAEYGNVLGGDILYQTKSGTNQFHGSAFYYLGNYNLNANTWANKHTATITPKNSFTRNIFGGTIGGPIINVTSYSSSATIRAAAITSPAQPTQRCLR